jgi:hypothetical protein
MPPQIQGKKLRRSIAIYGIEGLVIATITAEGITFKVQGGKLGICITWDEVVRASTVPAQSPERLQGDPYVFLQWQTQQIRKRRSKRLLRELQRETQGEV